MASKQSIKKQPENIVKEYSTGSLHSRLDHPVVISYDGEGMVIPPRGRDMKIKNIKLLGALPSGIVCVKR